MVDFLVTEVLQAHEPPVQALMLRTSVLERLSGPLCDAVLEQDGSAAMLDALSRTNLFLVPLDDEGGWYRFHHLFAQLLRVGTRAVCAGPGPGAAPPRVRLAPGSRDGLRGDRARDRSRGLRRGRRDDPGALDQLRQYVPVRHRPGLDPGGSPRRYSAATCICSWIQAWVLSLSARQEEAARAIAAIERLGDLGAGPLPERVQVG